MIENTKVNIKKHKSYQLIAESYERAESFYNARLTVTYVAKFKTSLF